jgi:hypothetical protein
MPEDGIDSAEALVPSFVELLTPDPRELPELQVVLGFPGRAVEDELLRIYQSLALDSYVEVRRQDIVHTHRLDKVLPEATIVWLRRDARVVHGPPREPGPDGG